MTSKLNQALVLGLFFVSVFAQDYTYWCSGNCSTPINPGHHAGIILMGGGTDVDDAFIQQAEWSGCGDFLVIRATRDNKYDDYIYQLTCAHSAATLYIHNRDGANDPSVVDIINEADAIFFAGGDQNTYLSDWDGTKLQEAVETAIQDRNVPIGGTSAGCDIQSYYVYTASNGSVYSDEALANPYNQYMTFSNYFILQKNNILQNTIIDTHFVTRKRFGRLISFVARMRTDSQYGKGQNVRGIGINEQTAFAIDLDTGIGKLLGPERSSEAYIIMPNDDPEVCQQNRPLTYMNVPTQKLLADNADYFNFLTWSGGSNSNYYNVSYDEGVPQQDSYHGI